MWLYRYECSITRYTIHTIHAQSRRGSTTVPRAHTVSWSPAARTQLASHTDSHWPTFQLPLHLQLRLNVYMTEVCVGDAVSWLSGWASLWHPPHRHNGSCENLLKVRQIWQVDTTIFRLQEKWWLLPNFKHLSNSLHFPANNPPLLQTPLITRFYHHRPIHFIDYDIIAGWQDNLLSDVELS